MARLGRLPSTSSRMRPSGQGTDIVFEISANAAQTEVRFTHVGLIPDHECFENCSTAWGFYITSSLRSLIATGEGQPNR